ncbi:MAG TPA: MFS transporter [Candidatus Limnocylindrales bacterium]
MKVFLSRTLILFYLASLGTATSFYLLLTVVPIHAMASGGEVGAGLATGALMLSTVAAEVAVPALITRFGYRTVFAAGAVLLGLPAFALSISDSMALVLTVCLVRGLGFGLVVVVGSALVATLVPANRRGEGLGVYGIVIGVPSIVALPLGVWAAGRAGYDPVFAAGALSALAASAICLAIPASRLRPASPALAPSQSASSQSAPSQAAPSQAAPSQAAPSQAAPSQAATVGDDCQANPRATVRSGDDCQANRGILWSGALIRPAIVFSTTAMACGIVVTFLPAVGGGMVEVALLVQAAAATLARWAAGRIGDRHGAARQLVPGVLLSAAGMAALILAGSPIAVLAGMVLFGTGFGITQNASLTVMYQRVPASGYGTVSAAWNFAYDAGLGAGAAGFGVLAAHTGFPLGFAITAALMLLVTAAALARRTGKAEQSRPLSPAPQS